MGDPAGRPDEIQSLSDARSLIDTVVAASRRDRLSDQERGGFIRRLLLNQSLQSKLEVPAAIDLLLSKVPSDEWSTLFGKAAGQVLPGVVVEMIDTVADVGHAEALRLSGGDPKTLVDILKKLDDFLCRLDEKTRYLRGMRAVCVQADVYRMLSDPKIWRRRKVPPFCLDNSGLASLKEQKRIAELPDAYEASIVELQRRDMTVGLGGTGRPSKRKPAVAPMANGDYNKLFRVVSPLRLGISSANASDNHIRTKEQGGKTLNAGIDLCTDGSGECRPPLTVSVRRLEEKALVLRSLSKGFEAEFEINARGAPAVQSDLFFAYRRGGDESLRMVKEALVHCGIISRRTRDVVEEVSDFTGGGGLEVITSSAVLQGSGLGTSSILAAAILKVFYRITGHSAGTEAGEYPELYDQSVLLEQSIGLNSGWQDARGARGGSSAAKDLYAPATEGPPVPDITFVEVDSNRFAERIVLFDTGVSRPASRGLNVVLAAYLRRDRHRYFAIRESLGLHDDMVAALRAGDYDALGRMATRYWDLRCILDPEATSPALQFLFEGSEVSQLCCGGMLTGAAGGGFALLVAADGATGDLKRELGKLRDRNSFAASRVVDYRLNSSGLKLTESYSGNGEDG